MSELDKRIKSWSQQLPDADSEAKKTLAQKIMTGIYNRELSKEQKGIQFYVRQLMWTRAALAVCMGLLVINIFSHTPQSVTVSPNGIVSEKLVLNHTELNEMRAVLSQLNSIFPEGIASISKTEKKMDITPEPSDIAYNIKDQQNILIEFHVVETDLNGNREIKKYDVIAKIGAQVEWADKEMVVWTHQIDDQYITVALDSLFKDKNYDIRVRDNFLQSFGQENLIAKGSFQESSYEIYQTVFLL